MVTVTGTATDAQDLYDKLIAFLTTNTTLVTGSQEWSQEWAGTGAYANDRLLMGQGLASADEIYVGMRLHVDTSADEHWIELCGAAGLIASADEYDQHYQSCPRLTRMFIDNGSMDYWFIANGRRFMVVVKISTVFEACYAGFFLPFGSPTEYPYPLFVGGSGGGVGNEAGQANSWRDTGNGNTLFPMAYGRSATISSSPYYYFYSGANVLSPTGDWIELSTSSNGGLCYGSIGDAARGTFYAGDDNFRLGWPELRNYITDCYGGDKALTPAQIFEVGVGRQTYGALQGVYRCQGDGMSSEDVITVGSVDHLVVQNVYRTGPDDYIALEIA